jgi:hypothetical protein
MFMVGAQQLFIFSFPSTRDMKLESKASLYIRQTWHTTPNQTCKVVGTKHARLLGGRYGVRCKRANMQKRGLIERNWCLCSFIIWECKDEFRVLVSLIFVPRFFYALPRCQGKIGTQKAFPTLCPYTILDNKKERKELTIGMVRFHS